MKNMRDNIKNILLAVVIVLLIFTALPRFLPARQAGARSGNSLTEMGRAYYLEQYGEGLDAEAVEAVFRNFGCHSEIHIFYEGKLQLRLYYSGGEFIEL